MYVSYIRRERGVIERRLTSDAVVLCTRAFSFSGSVTSVPHNSSQGWRSCSCWRDPPGRSAEHDRLRGRLIARRAAKGRQEREYQRLCTARKDSDMYIKPWIFFSLGSYSIYFLQFLLIFSLNFYKINYSLV